MGLKTLIASLCVVVACSANGSRDFRGVSWGATTREVLTAENSAPSTSSRTALSFDGEIAGYDALITYHLTSAQTVFAGEYLLDVSDKENRVDRLKMFLSEKYGANDAPAAGVLRWDSPSTSILLRESRGEIVILYLSKALSPAGLEGKKKALLNDF